MLSPLPVQSTDKLVEDVRIAAISQLLLCLWLLLDIPLFLSTRVPEQDPVGKGNNLARTIRTLWQQLCHHYEPLTLAGRKGLKESGSKLLSRLIRYTVRVHELVHSVDGKAVMHGSRHGVGVGGDSLANANAGVESDCHDGVESSESRLEKGVVTGSE